MIPELSKSAIKTKVKFENCVMTGNYECAYSLGLMSAAMGMEHIDNLEGHEELAGLRERVVEGAKTFETDSEEMKRLLSMIENFEVAEKFDDQMKELYDMGFADKKL